MRDFESSFIIVKRNRGYTLAGLISLFLIIGLFLTMLAPRFGQFENMLKREIDVYHAKTIAAAVYAIHQEKGTRPTGTADLAFAGYLNYSSVPYYPSAVAFKIQWDSANEFSIMEVNAKGEQIGDPLYP